MVTQHNNPKLRFIQHLRIIAFAALYAGTSIWVGAQADDTQIYAKKLPAAQTPNVMFTIDTSGSMDSGVQGGNQTRMEAVKDALTGLVSNSSDLKAGLQRFHYELGGPIIFPVVNLEETPEFLKDTTSVSSIDRSSDDAEEDVATGLVTLDDQALEMTELNTGGDTNIKMETFYPSATNDDDEDGDGGYSLSSPDLDIGEEDAGVRFRNVTIPRNAVILHAEIEFISRTSMGYYGDNTHVEIFGHDADSSPPFDENGANDIDNLLNDVTGASVRWSNIIPLSTDQHVTTPNIRSIVKEIVDRDGWASGNDMTILLEDEGGHRELSTVDRGAAYAPELRIQYVTSATDIPYQVRERLHDANEESGGNVITGYNGFYLFEDDEYNVEFSQAGAIFKDVDIPANADVLWADITWVTRNERDSQARDMEIYGIMEADPGGFSDGYNISGRPVTDNADSPVIWDALLTSGDEEIFAPDDGELMRSPNLEPLIEEIRSEAGYVPGNNIGFVFRDAAGGDINERQVCSFDGVEDDNGCPEDPSARPTLRLVYAFGSTDPVQQQIGLRFNNVQVPQGATIDSAHLEFTVDGATTEPGNLTIEIEDNVSPVTYSNNANETISGRTYSGSVPWTTDVWGTIGETKQSSDISSLISTVTNKQAWCGGGSLAFRITGTTARQIAEAWDKGGSGAPTLRVEYNTDTLGSGEGCTTRQTSVSITDSDNDVEEDRWDGDIRFGSNDLDIDDRQLVGLRFDNVQVPLGANITSTNLYLTADDWNEDWNSSVVIRAQQHPNAPQFVDTDGDVSGRVSSGDPSETWNITDEWDEDDIHSTQDDGTDLSSLIQGIVDGSVAVNNEQWASGNALVLVLDGQDSGRTAESCCGADDPARLDISYEVVLGDLSNTGTTTGREVMLGIIDDLVASGFTPPVDALFEAGAYFSGDPVHFGRTRGAGQSYESSGVTNDSDLDSQIDDHWDYELLREGELSRLSHFATYDPQTANIVREGDCTAENPNDRDCRTEHIDNGVFPSYVSPFDSAEACERGFLVLLSDGIANRNSSRDLIQNLTGRTSCPLDIPEIDNNGDPVLNNGSFVTRNPTSDEMCGLELAQYLHDKDFIDEGGSATDVMNNVRTFTIGFNLDIENSSSNQRAVEFLKALAFVGAGGDLGDPDGVDGVSYGDNFFTANTASELQNVFEAIVNEIIEETTSFVAPGISINAVNRLYHLNDIYYSLFKPNDKIAWLGNLKKFQLCEEGQSGCTKGEVLDQNGDPAVHTNENDQNTFGTLKSDAQGFWSAADDSAPEIEQGGAGEQIPSFDNRVVYVNTSGAAITPPTGDLSTNPETQGTSVHPIDRSTDIGDSPSDASQFNDLKAALHDQGNCNAGDFASQDSCLDELIRWMTGERFSGDIPRYGNDSDTDRWAFGDPMHSRPLILTYNIGPGADNTMGTNDDVPLGKVFVGTNDGGIRMISDTDGTEEWIYYPYSMLGQRTPSTVTQLELKNNATGSHVYGVDGTPTARINDEDDDFIIEPGDGDFVHLYIGTRRGGKELIALNVTPNDTGEVVPEVLWRIRGGGTDFGRLSQTWSTPRPVRIQTSGGTKSVLVFAGGYNAGKQDGVDNDSTTPDGGDNYNSSTSGDSEGNAIYIVDADTGERLWWASSDTSADTVISEMNTSIAAPVTLVDTNQDSHADRIYAVDLRGQVFRIDIASDLATSTAGVLANLGPDEGAIPVGEQAPNEDRRKFLYAPEVARVNDTLVVEQPYDMIGIVSGNRANPQARTVMDRAYAIRDFLTENPAGGLTSSNFPKCNPNATDCPTTAITHSHLSDVTEKGSFIVREEQPNGTLTLADPDGNDPPESALNDLQQSHGWYFDLEGEYFDAVTEPADPTTGEKGFSTATVLDGKMFFTTYLPPDDNVPPDDVCAVSGTLGTSRFYAVDFFTGAPAFDRNSDTSLDKAERFKNIGPGPSSDVTVVNQPGSTILQVPTRQGSTAEDPGFAPEFNKTFWLEER
ncbi:MAG: PilC/PilY family type IV pilus protein [Gammaproteobacteria bacterium]|nr:PilC/PilY family type IV pilus protein [Gammaproteobacteria bacterium]